MAFEGTPLTTTLTSSDDGDVVIVALEEIVGGRQLKTLR